MRLSLCCTRLLPLLLAYLGGTLLPPAAPAGEPPQRPKKIVLIAGKKSHGPGVHEYEKSVRLLKVLLDTAPNLSGITTEIHFDGWPRDERTLDDADTIMTISDGQDGDQYSPVPFMTPERMAVMEKQMRRGCGFVTFHFSTFTPDHYGPQILEWGGGYFDWQDEQGQRNWYSAIKTLDTDVKLGTPQHPISRGLAPFRLRDEFYYKLRFRENDARLRPILLVPELGGGIQDQIVAWAVERTNERGEPAGRGFGTSTGHFFDNWQNDNYRKLILNAIVWTAGMEVPAGGVQSRYYTEEEVAAALTEKPIRAVIVTGHQHPAHAWRETTLALEDIMRRDPRVNVHSVPDPEFLANSKLSTYDVVLLNYCNWERPGLSDAAKKNFVGYLNNGGGLVLVHFSNGAFHFSLPKAENSDWPEYRKICRRVWNHQPNAKGEKSGHDAYGKFQVNIRDTEHIITRGLADFETTDELYYRQDGEAPIHILATARSKDTGQDEPMAFVYDYGRGRVFQTVLGHAAESLLTPGTAELIRRGAVWAAGRKPIQLPGKSGTPDKAGAASPNAKEKLLPGKFGKALNAAAGPATAPHDPALDAPPLTVHCWVRLQSKEGFNILAAKNPKECGEHWELFSFAGSGHFTAYLPGYQPDHIRGGVNIVDDSWHHVAMTHGGDRVRLYVDGKLVADEKVKKTRAGGEPGPLWIGAYPPQGLGCSGLIDDVCIVGRLLDFDNPPDRPAAADEVLGLWRFDELLPSTQSGTPDASKHQRHAVLAGDGRTAGTRAPTFGHWGQEAVGFRWEESDSIDGRWNQTDVGPFLASILPLPGGTVAKGLSVRLGESGQAAVCYDTAKMTLRAGWAGGFLKFNPARYGIISPPQPNGEILFGCAAEPGWGKSPVHYQGLYLHGRRVTLAYSVDGATVLESPWLENPAGEAAAYPMVTRTWQLPPHEKAWELLLAEAPAAAEAGQELVEGQPLHRALHGARVLALALQSAADGANIAARAGKFFLRLPAANKPTRVKLLCWSGPADKLPQFARAVKASPPPEDLAVLTQPGEAIWNQQFTLAGKLGGTEPVPGKSNFAVDTLPLPLENPYHALLFLSGHDFFANGDLAVCTLHGDVWRVSGIDEKLKSVTWRRIATGLHQPLGLKIVSEVVHVLGRDQITRLHDQNGDGEIDFYENFHNAGETSTNGHDYAACLETDSRGNFYYVRANTGLVRVSPDGKHAQTVATGFRNPNGLGIGPGDVITVAPQEGEWTPASNIAEVRAGGHYGYLGPRVTPQRPLGYDPPLCYMPRLHDNSTGGQVWVTSDRWGLLKGQMLSFSFGRCWPLLVLREVVHGVPQGGTIQLPIDFDSGCIRGRFSPHDGQLYVVGLKGWVSSAVRDGCLQRVRFLGGPVLLPLGLHVHANGILLRFGCKLDPRWANDGDHFAIQQWNYRYRPEYGSPDYSAAQPTREGRDDVPVLSATLLPDGQSVFVELGDVRPVMQMSIRYALRSAEGVEFSGTIYNTINIVPETRLEPGPHARLPRPGDLPENLRANLAPGVLWRFTQEGNPARSDARADRLAALYVRADEAPATMLSPGRFRARGEGWLRCQIKQTVRFQLLGSGTASLSVNGREVLPAAALGSTPIASGDVALHRGFNRLEIQFRSPEKGDAALRLFWSSPEFHAEPVSPAVLFHDGADAQLAAAEDVRRGRALYAARHCAACHPPLPGARSEEPVQARTPSLQHASARFQTAWLRKWILDPQACRPDAAMPRLLPPDNPRREKIAADLAAYLASLKPATAPLPAAPADDDDALRAQGEVLFEQLACLGCHTLEKDAVPGAENRLSLRHVQQKFVPGALERFLLRPHAYGAAPRMGDFALSPREADALAAYLNHKADKPVSQAPVEKNALAGDAAAGQRQFRDLGCVQCHRLEENGRLPAPSQAAVLGRASAGGCLAQAPDGGKAPRWNFTSDQRQALAAFLAAAPLEPEPAAERSRRLIHELRCTACHARDGQSAVLPELVLEEGSLGLAPEPFPDLTWTGEKLRPQWLEAFLAGKLSYRPRPWLPARMPAFPAYAGDLARTLLAEHGVSPVAANASDRSSAVQPELVAAGERLTLKLGGLDCRQCHAPASEVLKLENKAQGIGLKFIAQRLQPEYYDRWMRDPLRIDPLTKMPRFSADGKRTQAVGILDGDAARQFAALWAYLLSLGD